MTKDKDDRNIRYLETRYMYEQRRNIYFANETTNMLHDESDIPDFVRAWNNGWSLSEISEYLGLDDKEAQLLAIDLIHTGKIKGNFHIFKPKAKGMDAIFLNTEIPVRYIRKDREIWVCLKDLWRHLKKPEHSFRKVVEGWGPDQRSNYKMQTNGGLQNHIFINTSGLSRLCRHLRKKELEIINRVMIVVDELSGSQKSLQERPGGIPAKSKSKNHRGSKQTMPDMRASN